MNVLFHYIDFSGCDLNVGSSQVEVDEKFANNLFKSKAKRSALLL